MQVLMLSWEYPPFSVGGLAQHVYELSRAMVKEGAHVEVITTATSPPYEELIDGVVVHRVVPYPGRELNFISWVQLLNMSMMEKGVSLLNQAGEFDIIHGHDWLVTHACQALKRIFHIPLLATIHATEYGRNGGLFTEEQKYIGAVEWQLAYESWKTICCSKFMEEELVAVFDLPRDKIEVVPNGISPESFKVSSPELSSRERFASPDEEIVCFVGRLVQEKGVQTLLNAVPIIREQFPRVKFVIAGRGPYEEELQRQVVNQGLEPHVIFTGYIEDHLRNQLYYWSSVAAFPSLYEPFGLVALEAMAAETPVVVGDSGGFRETIKHGINGLKSVPGDAVSLAEQICTLLESRELRNKIKKDALQDLHDNYTWRSIARKTMNIYRDITNSEEAFIWKKQKGVPILEEKPSVLPARAMPPLENKSKHKTIT